MDGRGHSGGRFRRERMSPQREPREAIPAEREGPERERVGWQRAEERTHWEQLQRRRGKALGELEKRSKREWAALYGRHQRQREQLAKDCHGVLGRFRAWRELDGKLREIGGTIRGRTEVLGRFRAELEDRQRLERISLGKAVRIDRPSSVSAMRSPEATARVYSTWARWKPPAYCRRGRPTGATSPVSS